SAATPEARARVADAFLRNNSPRELLELPSSKQVAEAWSKAIESDLTATELRAAAPTLHEELAALRKRTSDVLLAGKFAANGLRAKGLADLFRALSSVLDESIQTGNKIRAMLPWPIVLPPILSAPA